MSLSYAGVSLPVVTPEIVAKIEERCPLRGIYPFDRRFYVSGVGGLGRITRAWAEEPIELGKVKWPTGACRFAKAFFLVTDTQLAEMATQAGGTQLLVSYPLVLSDGRGTQTFQLVMLPPRPLLVDATGGGLYLLTLVDFRYFYQNAYVSSVDPSFTIPPGTSWPAVYSRVVGSAPGQYPITYLDTPNANYQSCPGMIFAGLHVASFLEYIATCLGQKIVAGVNASGLSVVNNATAQETWQTNLNAVAGVIGGGNFSYGSDLLSSYPNALPTQAHVTFPTSYPVQNGQVYSCQGSVPSTNTLYTYAHNFTYATITHLYQAFVANGVSNQAQCQAVATQWGADLSAWYGTTYNYRFAGIVEWNPTGIEDIVEWTYTRHNVSTAVTTATYPITEPFVPPSQEVTVLTLNSGAQTVVGQAYTYTAYGCSIIGGCSSSSIPGPGLPSSGWVYFPKGSPSDGGFLGPILGEIMDYDSSGLPIVYAKEWGGANGSVPGLMSTGTQVFEGYKYFGTEIGLGASGDGSALPTGYAPPVVLESDMSFGNGFAVQLNDATYQAQSTLQFVVPPASSGLGTYLRLINSSVTPSYAVNNSYGQTWTDPVTQAEFAGGILVGYPSTAIGISGTFGG